MLRKDYHMEHFDKEPFHTISPVLCLKIVGQELLSLPVGFYICSRLEMFHVHYDFSV